MPDDPTSREIDELRTELQRIASAVELALACSVAIAVATPVMFAVSVSTFLRPEWMRGDEMLVAAWAALLLLSIAVSWTAVELALACSVAIAVATPVMFAVSVSTFLRPEWMRGDEMPVAAWAALLLLSIAVSWTAVALVRRRTTRLP